MISSVAKSTFCIQRFRPDRDAAPHWQEFQVEPRQGMTVLQGLQQIREQTDPTLAWRSSCRMGVCGSCAMIVNGKPALACSTQLRDLAATRVRLQPLWNFPVLKDLVPDLDPMFDRHQSLAPYLIGDYASSAHESTQTPEELEKYLQFSYCIKCGACMAACPTAASDAKFLGPMPLTAAHRYNADSRDTGFATRKRLLTGQHATAHCHFAGECSRVCPKGVDPARAIQLLRRDLLSDWLGLRSRPVPQPSPSTAKPAANPIPAPEFDVTRSPDFGPDA